MSLKIIQTGTIRKLGCGFLFAFHSKLCFFHSPLAVDAPIRGVPSEYWRPVWYRKTRMVGLPDGEKTLRICITVYTQYRRVTDGQTDRQTDTHTYILPRHSPRYAYASRCSTNISLYLANDTIYSHSYYGRRIGKKPHPSFRMVPV